MRSKEAVELLSQKIEGLNKLIKTGVHSSSVMYNYHFHKWCRETECALSEIFGEGSKRVERFAAAVTLPPVKGTRGQLSQYRLSSMARGKAELEAMLSSISSIREYGIPSIPKKDESLVGPKAFIAHGGKSASRSKLCSFLEALGVEPLVVEMEPSEGRSIEEQVNKCMKEAHCAIVLATYGHIEDVKTPKKHPRLNVVEELGRCRKIFPDRTVLLLGKGVSLPSNISGIVCEHFTNQNMEKAFFKVAAELRAFGLIGPVRHGK